jgi:hypothetical protein
VQRDACNGGIGGRSACDDTTMLNLAWQASGLALVNCRRGSGFCTGAPSPLLYHHARWGCIERNVEADLGAVKDGFILAELAG